MGLQNAKLQHLGADSYQNLPDFLKPSSEPGSLVPYLFWDVSPGASGPYVNYKTKLLYHLLNAYIILTHCHLLFAPRKICSKIRKIYMKKITLYIWNAKMDLKTLRDSHVHYHRHIALRLLCMQHCISKSG